MSTVLHRTQTTTVMHSKGLALCDVAVTMATAGAIRYQYNNTDIG